MMRCPVCGGQRVYVSRTFVVEDFMTDHTTAEEPPTDYECSACGYKSQNKDEFEVKE